MAFPTENSPREDQTWVKTADWRFRRGFVEKVAMDATEYIQRGNGLHAAFPLLTGLNLQGWNRAVENFAHCAALEHLTHLQIVGNVYRSPLRADTLRTILGSEHFQNLRSLDLEGSWLGNVEIRAVAACANLRLWSLNLSSNRIDMDVLQSLGHARCTRELKKLILGSVHLNMDHLLVLTFSELRSHLQSLDLRGNLLGSQKNMMALVGLERLARLTELDLRSCRIGDAGVMAVAKTALWQQLERLVLWNNAITERGLIEITEREPPAKLRSLELQRNQIGDAGLMALALSPVLGVFSELHLEHNRIEDGGVLALAHSIYAERLRELHLRGNTALGDRGGMALASAGFPALEVLDLAGTQVGDATAVTIAESRDSKSLRVLDLGQTRITQAGAIALAESQSLPSLAFLDLRMNHLTGTCVTALKERFGNRVLV